MYTIIGLGGLEFLIIALIGILLFLLPIMALVDVVRSNFRGQNDKLIWVLVILFFNLIGAMLYFFIGRNQRIA